MTKYIYIVKAWGQPWAAYSSMKKADERVRQMIDVDDANKCVLRMAVL